MSYHRVREVLDHFQRDRKKLLRLSQSTSSVSEGKRVRLLLSVMKRHEAELSEILAQYEPHVLEQLLDCRVAFDPGRKRRAALDKLAHDQEMSLEEIVGAALARDLQLLEAYQCIGDAASAPEARELFSLLVAMERAKSCQYAENVLAAN